MRQLIVPSELTGEARKEYDRMSNLLRKRRQTNEPRITNVYQFTNGMVMVFDQFGQQMADYQGPANEAIPKLRAAGYKEPIATMSWR